MDKPKLLIIGAGAYAAVVAEAALLTGFDVVGFTDDTKSKGTVIYDQITIVSSNNSIKHLQFDYFVLAIGNNQVREKIYNELVPSYASTNIIHPNAIVSKSCKLGQGNVILAGAVVTVNAVVGVNNIINANSLIDHDSVIENHCHIAQGTIIGSNVNIASLTTTKIGESIPSFTKL